MGKVSQEQYQNVLAMTSASTSQPSAHLASTAISSSPSNVWIIDTGASNHICFSLSLLTQYSPCPSLSFVQLPNGSRASVTHTGSISFSGSLHLDNVIYIPSFKYNLLSITQLTKSRNCLFYPSFDI